MIMNLRYFKNIVPASALMLTVGLSSCTKDLDVTPIDPSTTMEVSETGLYAKCYANMALAGNGGANGDCDIDGLDGGTTGFVRQLWNANELVTDEAICAWGDPGIPGFNYNQWDAAHPMLQGFYYRLYAGINYCNHYLDVCAGVDATREAEVRFLRALYYYHLMDCYGNVPFALELSAKSPEQIQRADLFAWIESELKECVNNMQAPVARKSSDTGYGRADQDAANLLLARMYLNAEVYTGTARWADAKTYAEKVISGPHKLWTSGVGKWSAYQMLFMGDNGENGASVEAILPLLQDGVTTTSWGTTLFLMASCWKADMDEDSDYNTSEFWAGNRARSSQFIDTDYFLMRSAEAYLIAAEADARQNGGTTSDTGAGYINALRQRAHTNTLSQYSLDQILDERARELYYEGFRRTDLIRYGYFGGNNSGNYLWEWKGGAQNGASFPEYRNLYAIPAEDVNANPNLTQNTGY